MSFQSKVSIAESLRHFDDLPDSAHVKQSVVESLFACSHSSVWRRVKAGGIPRPKKFGSSSVWNVGELRGALARSGG